MNRALLAVVLVIATACGGGSTDSTASGAGEAAISQIETMTLGQWRRAHEHLHPAQQELVPADLFARCMADRLPGGVVFVDAEVMETFPEPYTIPAVGRTIDTTAVTLRITYEVRGEEIVETHTSHVVDDGDGWRWFMGDPEECLALS